MTTATTAENIDERFWGKVERAGENDCWNWAGALDSSGYGSFNAGKVIGAHRMAYSLEIGEIPGGLHVCHHCDNRRCCNPKHFFIGTNDDNHRDKITKGRQAKGERAGCVSLTEAQVRIFRDTIRSGVTIAELVRGSGVPHCTVYSAVYGVTWKHVEGALAPPALQMDLVGQSKSITARQLRDATSTYVKMAARGMKITITSDGVSVAVISPPEERIINVNH